MNIETFRRELVETLTQPPVTLPASAFGLYGINKDRVAKLCSELLKQDTLSLSFPKELLQSYQDRNTTIKNDTIIPLTQATTIDHCYKRYGGSGIFSYIELKAIPDGSSGITIVEALPHKIDHIEEKDKFKSWQVYDSLPFILKAIVDHVRLYQIQGIRLTLSNARYHPIDYRNYAYYICTRKCLNKLFGIGTDL